MNKAHLLAIGVWLMAILSGVFLDYWHESQFLPPPEERRREDVIIDVFGDVKTIAARYLWFKMDLFHEVLDEEGVAPEKQTQVVPLLRMVTLLDPSMVGSYDQMAYDLHQGHGKTEEAIELLDEGLRQNSESWMLWQRKATLLRSLGKYEEALESALQAQASAIKEASKVEESELAGWQITILNCSRLVYWNAKEVGDFKNQTQALDILEKIRPRENLWKRERRELQEKLKETNHGGS